MAQPIIEQIHKFLLKNKETVSVAESCTGGLTSALLTQLSGSSKYFILGVVVYSNKTKEEILGIPGSLLKKKGAVSPEVALLLAKNIRKLAGTHYGIGITGVAGPTGATRLKPAGTVFIAVSKKTGAICKKFFFTGNRSCIRKKSALKALELLKKI